MGVLKLKYGTKEEYDQELVYDSDTLYFLYDTRQIFKGDEQYTNIIEANILWDYSDSDEPIVYTNDLDDIRDQGIYFIRNSVSLSGTNLDDVCILRVSLIESDGTTYVLQELGPPVAFMAFQSASYNDEFVRLYNSDPDNPNTWTEWAINPIEIRMSQVSGLSNALGNKVDISALAPVATSGSYNDLTDKLTAGTGVNISNNTVSISALVINDYTV